MVMVWWGVEEQLGIGLVNEGYGRWKGYRSSIYDMFMLMFFRTWCIGWILEFCYQSFVKGPRILFWTWTLGIMLSIFWLWSWSTKYMSNMWYLHEKLYNMISHKVSENIRNCMIIWKKRITNLVQWSVKFKSKIYELCKTMFKISKW